MATTKIWPIRDNLKRVVNYASNPEKTDYDDLKQALHYAENENKTSVGKERFCFVTGVNCRAESAYEEMREIKERFGKTGGNVAYHAYQSYKPGEVTPKQCHEIGVKLAQQLWGKHFQVLVATHLDKGHLHSHFVINSVSLIDGKKFNCTKRVYYDMREASDKLCKQNGLSVIKNPKGKTPRNIYFAEKNGEPTKHNLMREAIDTALKISSTQQDFKQALRDMGYTLNDDPNRKYAALCRIGDKKPVRLFRLGENYDLPYIGERLYQNRYRYGSYLYRYSNKPVTVYVPPKQYKFKGSFQTTRKITGFYALYLHYCYLLGVIPKRENSPRPLSPQLREAVRRLHELSSQIKLISREKLKTTDDVQCFVERKSGEMRGLIGERQKLYNRLRRCDNSEEIRDIKTTRDELTKRIVSIRNDIKLAKKIPEREQPMREDIRAELAMRTEKREREKMMATKKQKRERSYER